MEFVKIVDNPCNTDELLFKLCRYITEEEKTQGNIGGRGVSPFHAYADMRESQELWGTDWGRRSYHIVVSFEDALALVPNDAMELAFRISSLFFPEYQVLYGVHVTQSHLHIHFAINTTSLVNGKKLHLDYAAAQRLYESIRLIVADYIS